ncbi:CMP-N-acetylneuraminate-poly-alpha-2,8-sialyltransferase-like [Saccoglossus kowalevskii]|uniref:CMP-N-acetylneuraminate-poly-alpha-2, 8-sialyltransferase-like n=1 Tax=Saccoglossus kowalevskii TaxID=10224 RepID=A0ABM0MKJ3_SACKO|nr:PREDICTED: CMP-N-acetylneuraminate-poly-alpha-2,8-sialyltransferase-like [Saccoglossus kowalevskii]
MQFTSRQQERDSVLFYNIDIMEKSPAHNSRTTTTDAILEQGVNKKAHAISIEKSKRLGHVPPRSSSFVVKEEDGSTHPIPQQNTCAVVGNSGILLDSNCGEAIDSNDFVIRCNIPEIEKYSRDVGTKTNITHMNPRRVHDLFEHARQNKDYLNLYEDFRFLNNSILWSRGSAESAGTQNLLYSTNYLMSKFNLNFRIAYTKGKLWCTIIQRYMNEINVPTAGMLAIAEAFCLCDKISVYGFYPFLTGPDDRTVPYHYFGEMTTKTLDNFDTGHNFRQEYSILQLLDRDGILELVSVKCK